MGSQERLPIRNRNHTDGVVNMQTIYTIGLGLELLTGIGFAAILSFCIGVALLHDFGPRGD